MNQETQDVTMIDAARELEVTKKATSEMSTLAAPLENMASEFSGTDNPIALIDGIYSFLKTLEKFNGIVDQIATVSITHPASPCQILIRCLDSPLRASSMDDPVFSFEGLAVAFHQSPNLIYGWQIIIVQVHLDVSVGSLLSKMDEVYTFLTTAGLDHITSMKAIVERITRQTVQCSYFVQAYCANQKFRKLTWS